MAVSIVVAPLVMNGLPALEARGWLRPEAALTRRAWAVGHGGVSTIAAVSVVWVTPRTDAAVLGIRPSSVDSHAVQNFLQ